MHINAFYWILEVRPNVHVAFLMTICVSQAYPSTAVVWNTLWEMLPGLKYREPGGQESRDGPVLSDRACTVSPWGVNSGVVTWPQGGRAGQGRALRSLSVVSVPGVPFFCKGEKESSEQLRKETVERFVGQISPKEQHA